MKNTDGEHLYKNTGAQAAQIKPTAAESFQKQIKKASETETARAIFTNKKPSYIT